MTKKPLTEIEHDLYQILSDKTLNEGCILESCTDVTRFVFSDGLRFLENGDGTITIRETAERFKIIGHEPTLNDILLKLGKKHQMTAIKRHSDTGRTFIYADNKTIKGYDLTKSFDNQAEETKRKLHSLLIKGNSSQEGIEKK